MKWFPHKESQYMRMLELMLFFQLGGLNEKYLKFTVLKCKIHIFKNKFIHFLTIIFFSLAPIGVRS